MRAVYGALANELGADPSYGGNLIKCPFSNSHDWYITGAEPSYTLEQLAEYLDLAPPNMPIITHRRIMTTTLGVTVQLSTIHGTEHTKSLINSMNNNYSSRFWQSLKNLTQTLINRCYPMKPIISQGQSHAFVSRHDGASTIKRLLRKQRQAGRKGDSSQGGKARSASYDDQRTQAQNLRATGLSIRKIAEQMKVSKTSVQKWIKVY